MEPRRRPRDGKEDWDKHYSSYDTFYQKEADLPTGRRPGSSDGRTSGRSPRPAARQPPGKSPRGLPRSPLPSPHSSARGRSPPAGKSPHGGGGGKKSASAEGLGFPDLCRYFYNELKIDFEDFTANKLATTMIECWRKNKYMYSDLEEMYLVNMQTNKDRELLARELGNTIGDNRDIFPPGISCSRLVNLTIKFFKTQPSVMDKLHQLRQEQENKEESGSISSQEGDR